MGPRPRSGAVRPAGDLADLVARSSGRNQGRHDLCARNPARQKIPLRGAHRGNADRAQGFDRDRFEFPGQTDHGRRSAAGIWRSCEMTPARKLNTVILRSEPLARSRASSTRYGEPRRMNGRGMSPFEARPSAEHLRVTSRGIIYEAELHTPAQFG